MKRTAPNTTSCILLLAAIDMGLRTLGFERVARFAGKLAGPPKMTASDRVIQPTLDRIITATAFYPGRSKCLEQAIAAFVLLRRRGIPVRLQLGVQPYPFHAHAWVELNGQPLTESPEVTSGFALLPEIVA